MASLQAAGELAGTDPVHERKLWRVLYRIMERRRTSVAGNGRRLQLFEAAAGSHAGTDVIALKDLFALGIQLRKEPKDILAVPGIIGKRIGEIQVESLSSQVYLVNTDPGNNLEAPVAACGQSIAHYAEVCGAGYALRCR